MIYLLFVLGLGTLFVGGEGLVRAGQRSCAAFSPIPLCHWPNDCGLWHICA
jgi:hypothetical protein